jgi:hypothetical protein
MRPVVKNPVDSYNKGDYNVMRNQLLVQLGSYCSYCEAPISNDSAVEHKVPKSEKDGCPSNETQWRNLLLACQTCNSAKGPSPKKVAEASQNTDEFTATLKLWVWPDRNPNMRNEPAPPVDEIYRLLKVSRMDLTQNALVAHELLPESAVTKTKPWATTAYNMAWLLPNDTYIGTLGADTVDVRKRVKAMLRGLQLNYYEHDSVTFTHRRVLNRTAAYDAATAAVERLRIIVENYGNTKDVKVKLMIRAIRQSIIATGFWTTWFTVFRAALDQPLGTTWTNHSVADRKKLLEHLMIRYMPDDPDGNPDSLIFPGTDVSRLNLDGPDGFK